jgi:mannose-6-phosphate isomerase-like protein (cupin superfamily)
MAGEGYHGAASSRDGAGLSEGARHEPAAASQGRQSPLRSRAEHAARPGFRITELQLSATQKVPWHTHTNVSDTFYVLEGHMRLFLQDPKEEVNLKPGEVYVVRPARPHLVTNGGTKSLTFLVLQGVGEYDFVPLVSR